MATINILPSSSTLPTGLEYHCETCKIVIPNDSPRPSMFNCEQVVQAKLTWYNPNAPIAHQFCMAAAAWELIYDRAIKEGHQESVDYKQDFKLNRKAHYAKSITMQSMTPKQVAEDLAHPRHGRHVEWLYKKDKEDKELNGN